ncbi:MAG: gliding motility-associated C-terminal domain-containing protein [Saprospiraceae bacterium]|nr:gliding motility-associated C-terminal domain-containing protein [Saprospiraceae bacterium]
MKKLVLSACMIVSYFYSFGQSVYHADLQLMSCAGNNLSFSSNNWQVSYSIGEIAINQSPTRREGFQQTYNNQINPPTKPISEDYNTIITPNGDSYNEYFTLNPQLIEPAVFSVFNKWGTKVYFEENFDNNWNGLNLNGDHLSDGVYIYFIVTKQNKLLFKGTITIKQQ